MRTYKIDIIEKGLLRISVIDYMRDAVISMLEDLGYIDKAVPYHNEKTGIEVTLSPLIEYSDALDMERKIKELVTG